MLILLLARDCTVCFLMTNMQLAYSSVLVAVLSWFAGCLPARVVALAVVALAVVSLAVVALA